MFPPGWELIEDLFKCQSGSIHLSWTQAHFTVIGCFSVQILSCGFIQDSLRRPKVFVWGPGSRQHLVDPDCCPQRTTVHACQQQARPRISGSYFGLVFRAHIVRAVQQYAGIGSSLWDEFSFLDCRFPLSKLSVPGPRTSAPLTDGNTANPMPGRKPVRRRSGSVPGQGFRQPRSPQPRHLLLFRRAVCPQFRTSVGCDLGCDRSPRRVPPGKCRGLPLPPGIDGWAPLFRLDRVGARR